MTLDQEKELRAAGPRVALQRAPPFLPAIADATETGVAILDLDGVIVTTNAQWQRLHAGSSRQIRGKRRRAEPLAIFDPREFRQGLRSVLVGVLPEFCIQYRRDSAGEQRWFQTRAARIDGGGAGPGFVVVTHEDITDNKRAEDELRRVSRRTMQSQDDERRRIAREIHDTTVQNLVGAGLQLDQVRDGALSGEDAALALAEVRRLLELSMQELRTLSYILHPPMLDELGLVPAIRWYARGFEQRSGIRIEIVAPQKLGRMEPDTESTLFRVVQEGLGNIHRHSGSPDARITLRRRHRSLILEIADRGRGMRANSGARDSAAVGVGIAGMRLRLRQIGGTLEISSGSQGTTLRATVPLALGDR